MFTRFKFRVHPSKRGSAVEESEKRFAGFVSTLVCIGAYYLFGAHALMLVLALGSYIIVRLILMRRR